MCPKNNELSLAQAYHRMQAPVDAENLSVRQRIHALLHGEVLVSVLHDTLHGVSAPSDIVGVRRHAHRDPGCGGPNGALKSEARQSLS